MKKSKQLIGIMFALIIFLTGCEEASPDLTPGAAVYPTPEIIPDISPIPTALTSPTPSIVPTSTPLSTEEPTPAVEPVSTPTEFPTETPLPSENPLPGKVMITEIMYNPSSPDAEWEWIEVYNGTDSEVDLSGWVIDDGNKTPHTSSNITTGSIPSHETGILFNGDMITVIEFETAWGDGINLIPVTDWGTMGLNNTGDKIGIWNSFAAYNGDHELFANALCAIHYSEEISWPEADGSGSIYLTDLAGDYKDGAYWALSINGTVTPLGTSYQSNSGNTNSGEDIGSP